jgi:phospholipid-binding lipoprotein MlaA
VASVFAVTACATVPPPTDAAAMAAYDEANDPLEPFNRAIFEFNLVADRYVIKPIAEAYGELPAGMRKSVRHFLDNLKAPLIAANSVLQGEPGRAADSLTRFVTNTIFGGLGLFDVVPEIPKHDEDFGQTLAVWGLGEGPYLMLPILGPSNLRDLAGRGVDWFADPASRVANNAGVEWATYARTGTSGVDERHHLLKPLDDLEKNSLDYYAALRNFYRQKRGHDIRNGAPAPKKDAPKFDLDD